VNIFADHDQGVSLGLGFEQSQQGIPNPSALLLGRAAGIFSGQSGTIDHDRSDKGYNRVRIQFRSTNKSCQLFHALCR